VRAGEVRDYSLGVPLKNSIGPVIVRKRSRKGGEYRHFASRSELGSELGEVENGDDEHFQPAASQPAELSDDLCVGLPWMSLQVVLGTCGKRYPDPDLYSLFDSAPPAGFVCCKKEVICGHLNAFCEPF
jgi:hypothetical protein